MKGEPSSPCFFIGDHSISPKVASGGGTDLGQSAVGLSPTRHDDMQTMVEGFGFGTSNFGHEC